LAAIHNFIRRHDAAEVLDFVDILSDVPDIDSYGDLATGPVRRAETCRAKDTRDEIAQAMWDDYQAYLQANDML
jgi:hypothetical protein